MTTIGSLFTGYGGLDLAVEAVTGARTIWCSDNDAGACKILAHRFPDVPNLGDITWLDWSAVPRPEVLTGGFPCQDVSMAGRRAGMKPGTRSGLWQIMAKAIDALRPALVVAENVRGLLSADAHSDVEPCPWCVGDPGDEPPLRALGAVLGDLADIGYDAAWHGLTAASVGAPHGRFRVFIVAWPQSGHAHGGDRSRWTSTGLKGEAGSQVGPAANADGLGHERAGDARGRRGRPANGGVAAADPPSDGRNEGRPESAGIIRGSDAAQCGDAAPTADSDRVGPQGIAERDRQPQAGRAGAAQGDDPDGRLGSADATGTAWGQFEPAIRRWERLTRPAPAPTETSSRGAQRLSPRFVEWMMGLPDGHVTDVPELTRFDQLKALGNGVVPAQAAAALRILLPVIP